MNFKEDTMKQLLVIGFTATIMSFTTLSYANFSFHSADANACEHITGEWVGTGKASNWFIGECIYRGSGNASTLDASGNFSVTVVADKQSGSIFCPAHTTKQLNGNCFNGDVQFITEYGAIKGTFADNQGEASGTLTVSPGIHIDVGLNFNRVG